MFLSQNKKLKNKIAVLVGGPSDEYDVSLKSGENILENLPSYYEGKRVLIDKNENWEIPLKEIKKNFDKVFIAMHGKFGEDGTLQRILEDEKIPYTGSSSLVSALGMNKFFSLQIFKLGGLNIPRTILISKKDWILNKDKVLKDIIFFFNPPFVIKPNMSGSSIGIKIVNKKEDLDYVLKDSFTKFKEILVEEFIEGRELTCGVLDAGDGRSAFSLLPTEIIYKGRDFFDYDAKYDSQNHIEITPPPLPSPFIKEIRNIALYAHKLIGARHFSRTDMILGKDKKIYVLEINTIPGFTKQSLIPQEINAYGWSLEKALDFILKYV